MNADGKPHRVVVDATGLRPGAAETGTWRVAQELTQRLADRLVAPDFEFLVACKNPSVLGEAASAVRTTESFRGADLVLRPHQVVREQDLRSLFAGPWRVMINHQDTIASEFLEYHPTKRHADLALNVQRSALRRADFVTTFTETSLAETLRFCPDLEPRRLRVIHAGVDHLRTPNVERPPSLGVSGPFLAIVGTALLHKNRPFGIEVLDALRRRGIDMDLVLLGPEPYFGSSVAAEERLVSTRPELRDRIHRIGPASPEEKWWVLANATAVLYPTTFEGFGLVPFEAAHVGTPCLSARVSSLPEVCGDAARLANGFDPDEWAAILGEWVADPATADAQVAALTARRDRYRWDDAADLYRSAIEETLRLPRRFPADQLGPSSLHVESRLPGLRPIPRLSHDARRIAATVRRGLESKFRTGERGYSVVRQRGSKNS